MISTILGLSFPYFLALLLLFPTTHGYLYRAPDVLRTGAETFAILLGFMIIFFLLRGSIASAIASVALFGLYIYSLQVAQYPESGMLVAPALGLGPISTLLGLMLGVFGGTIAAIAKLLLSRLSVAAKNWRVIELLVHKSGLVIGCVVFLATSFARESIVVTVGLWILVISIMTTLISWGESGDSYNET